MKKALILIIMVLSVSLLFAAEGDGLYAGVTDLAFRPTTLDRDRDLNYSLYGNAATLAEDGFKIQLPYFESSSYNVTEALKDRGVAEALSGITKFQFTKENWITYMLGLVMATGSGYNDVISSDIGLGAQIGHVAFGLNTRAQIRSMPKINEAGELEPSSSALGNGYVPQLDTALTVAYGLRVMDTDLLTLDLGAAVRFAQKVYMLQINSEQIAELIGGSKDFETLAARGGFAFPIDVGVTLGVFGGKFQIQASADNLNGFYYMKNYQNSKNALMFKDGTDKYTMYTPFSLELGVAYSPKLKIVNPKVSVFFTGINQYIKEAGDLSAPGREIFRYLDAGVELDVVDIVRLRASYRYGYPEFAVGVNAFGNLVELSYGFHEAGKEYGLKPVDKVTIRFRLGFEK